MTTELTMKNGEVITFTKVRRIMDMDLYVHFRKHHPMHPEVIPILKDEIESIKCTEFYPPWRKRTDWETQ